MATGQRAFVGRSKMSTLATILQSDPKPAAELNSGLPRELAPDLIQRCLRKDPAWRYQSAADLKISLCDLQHEIESGTAQLGPAAQAAPLNRRGVGVAAALALGLAAGAAGAWWLSSPGAATPARR